MKQQWTPQELIDQWTLSREELDLVDGVSKTTHNRFGCALLLKYFQIEGKFPGRKQDIPGIALQHIAQQLSATDTFLRQYELTGRVAKRHRVRIRTFLGVRAGIVADSENISAWLSTQTALLEAHDIDRLKETAYEQYKALKIEPPSSAQTVRLARSAVRVADEQFYTSVLEQLPQITRERLGTLLTTAGEATEAVSGLFSLKDDPGPASLESLLAEVAKLERIDSLAIPADLFARVSRKRLLWCKQRIAVEELHEVRRHPEAIRYTLLAAFCYERKQEITDNLIELMISITHKLSSRSEHRIDKQVLKEVKKVRDKGKLLYDVASAAVDHPEEAVKDIIYPIAGEQKLRDIISEFKANDSYSKRVQTVMRGSYSNHYHRMVPPLLNALTLQPTNEISKPVLTALDLIRRYAGKKQASYDEAESVPLSGIVPDDWLPLVKQGERVNRIGYELCVLKVVRDKLRCKELYAQGAYRYRNPDEDLPADFDAKRTSYYADLHQPLSADEFIVTQQQELKTALATLDKGITKNPKVGLTTRAGKSWIAVSKLDPQPEPKNLAGLKAEVGRRWEQLYLLDILKEADMRIGFTNLFKSPTPHEALPRETLQRRLLLCLYGLGTNTGMKRVASGAQTENFRDLLYVRNRFITKDTLRAAIAEIANAILRDRLTSIWGEATSCAADSKKFGAWDQNLLTEWHIRYRGPGIMVYWHVEKKSLCIYSQIKRCSSSEVAAMIEGVLRHATDMTVEKSYVDSHGQDEAAFAFCYLLNFQLLPRLKGIGGQKLYRAETGSLDIYPNLKPVLTRPIDWDLIKKHYDEIVKYTVALKLGTADAEALLSRFTRNRVTHPAYKAVLELGKVRKTIFLCEYLNVEALRQEVQEGCNVVENWNSANGFIWYGKGGEIAVNDREDQEVAILSLHLLQISLVYINTLLVQKVLAEERWLSKMQAEDFRGLTPLFYSHVNPYGRLLLDMEERILIE